MEVSHHTFLISVLHGCVGGLALQSHHPWETDPGVQWIRGFTGPGLYKATNSPLPSTRINAGDLGHSLSTN
jgi:hypothetical protein